jgi:hypothetical protein
MTNYEIYRGKCKEFCEQAIANDPSLTLVRGYYHCPFQKQKEQHWWTVTSDGTIYDPTKLQFLSNGAGEYEVFNGTVSCEECGKQILEADIIFCGSFPVCSNFCGMKLVGL